MRDLTMTRVLEASHKTKLLLMVKWKKGEGVLTRALSLFFL